MPRGQKYYCTRCGEVTARENLTVKRVSFQTMGEGSKQKRSRVIAWLCGRCLEWDKDWNRAANTRPTRNITRILPDG